VTPAGRRRKGSRIERMVVQRHQESGIPAQRIPLSGAMANYKGDVQVGPLRCEVKARKNGEGFAVISRWLAGNDLLFLARDGITQPMVVMEWGTYIRFLTAFIAEKGGLCSDED